MHQPTFTDTGLYNNKNEFRNKLIRRRHENKDGKMVTYYFDKLAGFTSVYV